MTSTPAYEALTPDEQRVIAMEVWEAVLDGITASTEPVFDTARERFGVSMLREIVAPFVPYVWQAWEDRDVDTFDAPFDWEWCPRFLRYCIDWTSQDVPTLRADWAIVARNISEED